MAQAHADADDQTDFRLLYSVRTPEDLFFEEEWRELDDADSPLEIDFVFTRRAPVDWVRPPGRITRERLAASAVPASRNPRIYVCGSTGFVERVADWLVELGHEPRSIRTERYGGT